MSQYLAARNGYKNPVIDRCESCSCSFSTSNDEAKRVQVDSMKAKLRSFSEHDLRMYPIQPNLSSSIPPVPIRDIRADYIPYQASNPIGASFATVRCRHGTMIHTSHPPHNDTLGCGTNTIVVMPSIDLDDNELKRMGGKTENYEERQLYHLLLLIRNTSFRVVYIGSCPVEGAIIRYYLSLDGCGEVELSERLSRCFFLNPPYEANDSSHSYSDSLSKKVLKNEKLLSAVRDIVERISTGENPTAGLSVFCGSETCDAISSHLNLRLLEASGNKQYFGSKQGSREIFYLCGVPCSHGCPDLGDDDLLTIPSRCETWSKNHKFICTPRDLAIGLARQIIYKNVKPKKWVVKLNQGFSGKGNASLFLDDVQNKVYPGIIGEDLINAMADDIEKEFLNMKYECCRMTWRGDGDHVGFAEQISRLGVIAEAFIDGCHVTSPSVQAIIDPNVTDEYNVDMLSTHEQVLNGQIFTGCKNPARAQYRELIVTYARKIGRELARNGVVGHFAVDFLATNLSQSTIQGAKDEWNVKAIEINLRQGGTTHPYSTMASLCGGSIGQDGVFYMKDGGERCYVATDNYVDYDLTGIKADNFLLKFNAGLYPHADEVRWDNKLRVGVVFHLLAFLEVGKIGWTSIGKTPEQADYYFERTTEMMKHIARDNYRCKKTQR